MSTSSSSSAAAAAAAAVAATTTTSTTTVSPIKTCNDCDKWLENGNGNKPQKHCQTYHPKRKFISIATFNKKLKLSKPDMILKWRDLPINETYYINRIIERVVKIEGRKQTSRYLELDSIETRERKSVWITNVIDSELQSYNLTKATYIRPLGLKTSENGRSYHNFEIVVDYNDCAEE